MDMLAHASDLCAGDTRFLNASRFSVTIVLYWVRVER